MLDDCLVVAIVSFLLGVYYILILMICGSYYLLRASQVSKARDEHELSANWSGICSDDKRHEAQIEWVLPELADTLRGSARVCNAARGNGTRPGSSAARQVAQDGQAP